MRRLLMALLVLVTMTSLKPNRLTTIFVIGDSTAAKKDLSTGSPERGWAMALQSYFDSRAHRKEGGRWHYRVILTLRIYE